MSAPAVPLAAVRRLGSGGAFDRGVGYFRSGAVARLAWDERARVLTADVQGGARSAYRSTALLLSAGAPRAVGWTACTCPVGQDCKHVVAMLLANNAAHGLDPADDAPPAPVSVVASAPAAPTAPTWRDLVPAAPAQNAAILALGIELRQRDAFDPRRWDPRRAHAVTPRDLARRRDDLQIALRPFVRGARGGWIKGDASWDAVRRSPARYGVEPTRWFTELQVLLSPTSGSGAFASAAEWATLDGTSSPHVWTHLATAGEAGIEIVAAHAQQRVLLAERASVDVVVGRGDGESLTLRARVVVDDAEQDAALAHALGTSGLFTVTLDTDPIVVTLAPATVSAAAGTLLGRASGLEVPAEEAHEFWTDAYPRLARRASVIGDGVSLPAPARPALVVTARFRGDGVAFALHWSYPGVPRFAYPPAEHADRDRDVEAEIRSHVEAEWAAASDLPFTARGELHDADTAEFATRVLSALEGLDDVRIEIEGPRPRFRELIGAPEVSVSTVETTDSDWFDLGVIVTIDGRSIPLAPLLTALTRGKARMKLSDGAYFSLAHPSLHRLRELLEEAASLDEWETGARISRYQTALWDEFEDLADIAEPAVAWRETVRALSATGSVDRTPVPTGLVAELRPYQHDGYDWLAFLWRHRLGGVLADDMGLGKTLQTLAFLAHAHETGERRPFLVVAPTSVLGTWASEAARFVPGLRVRVVGATRAASGRGVDEVVADADVVVTSYALLRLDEDEFAGVDWAAVVLDEAQFIKNPQTKLHRAAKALRTDTVVAVTGTPLENGLGDLWALLSLTAPGLFASARAFRQDYIGPIEQGKVPENVEGGPYRAARLARLRRRIRPLVLRRTKELVAAELPPKQEQDLTVELSPAHRALYETVLQRERQKVLGLLDDLDRNRFIVFRSLTLLRMLSLAPVLVDERHAALGSSKLDALLAHLVELAAEGHRALVFSQFTSFLSLAAERLAEAGIAHAYLDGSTRRREDVVTAFRTGDAPVFLISLKAGGFGLTLTEADYVFVLDPWWNPAAEAQAVDRTHRIGQEQHVFVYRMIAADTIEEKVRALQARKARLFQSVMNDDDLFAQALTADDIRGLLES